MNWCKSLLQSNGLEYIYRNIYIKFTKYWKLKTILIPFQPDGGNLWYFKLKLFIPNSNFLIPIFLQADCVNLRYFELRLFDL